MNSVHIEGNHEEQLQSFLEHENALERLRASELGSCTACQTLLAQWVALRASLDEMGSEERLGLEEARNTPSPMAASHVQDTLQHLLPDGSASLRRVPPAWTLVLAAAALLLLWLQPFGGDASQQDDFGPTLGVEASAQLKTPRKAGDSLELFEWEPHPAPGATYQVAVYSDETRGHEIARSAMLGSRCVWTPTPAELGTEGLEAIWWTVEVSTDMAGVPTTTWFSERIEL